MAKQGSLSEAEIVTQLMSEVPPEELSREYERVIKHVGVKPVNTRILYAATRMVETMISNNKRLGHINVHPRGDIRVIELATKQHQKIIQLERNWLINLLQKRGGSMTLKDITKYIQGMYPPEAWCREWDHMNQRARERSSRKRPQWAKVTPPNMRIYQIIYRIAREAIRRARRWNGVLVCGTGPSQIVTLTNKPKKARMRCKEGRFLSDS